MNAREDLRDTIDAAASGGDADVDEALDAFVAAETAKALAKQREAIAAAIRAKYPMPGVDVFTWSAALVYSVGENCAHIALAGGVR
jgi:hypothetical protein